MWTATVDEGGVHEQSDEAPASASPGERASCECYHSNFTRYRYGLKVRAMCRIDTIVNFVFEHFDDKRKGLLLGLINCLNADEVCKLVLWSLGNDAIIRRYALRKVIRDMERQVQGCHRELVKFLLDDIERRSSPDKNTCGYILSTIYMAASEDLREEIVSTLLRSGYRSLRRRAYKILRGNWNDRFVEQLEENWQRYKEVEVALLVIDNFPVTFLMKNRSALIEVLTESWQLARFFVQLTKIYPEALNELKDIDSISYLYVAAKNRISIAADEAAEIRERNRDNDRITLLFWAVGELGHWDVLLDAEKEYPVFERGAIRS